MLTVTGISNEKGKLINHICNIMWKRHNILPTRTSFFISRFQMQEKLKECRMSK